MFYRYTNDNNKREKGFINVHIEPRHLKYDPQDYIKSKNPRGKGRKGKRKIESREWETRKSGWHVRKGKGMRATQHMCIR